MGEDQLIVPELPESDKCPNPESEVEEVGVEEEEECPVVAEGGAEGPVVAGGGEEDESVGEEMRARGRLARERAGGEDRETAQKS